MTETLRYALLGLGSGGIYALLGLGMVIVYRGSGVINFAHSGFALVGAYVVYDLQTVHHVDVGIALAAGVVVVAAIGVLTQLLVLRPLRTASPLTRVIATLGILTILTEAVRLHFGAGQLLGTAPLPSTTVTITGDVQVGRYALYLVAIAVGVTVLLVLTATRTRFGHAITAAAENPRAAAALGWSPDLLATVTWGLGGALAGLAGGLYPSITFGFVSPAPFGILIISALATALLASFRSYPLACAGGLLIGALQSLTTHWTNHTGVPDSVPFMVIIVVMVLRGRGLPLRGSYADRLPRVGTGRVRPAVALVALAVALLFLGLVASPSWYVPTIISATFALVGLSVVVLTGYAGQLSIAQFALAGMGAFGAGRLSAAHGWSFVPAVLAGVAIAAVVGFLFGLPALRTRGVNLAVVTFGLGFSIFEVVFSNSSYTGGDSQTKPATPSILGWDVDPVDHPRNYAIVCVVALAVVALAVANLRRGRSGRRLLAVRTNERAAASIGVDVFEAKLFAFAFSAAIAGLGGVLLAFSYPVVEFVQLFQPGASISVLLLTVIGGAGYIAGPMVGSVLASGGLITLTASQSATVGVPAEGGWQEYLPLTTGALLILALILSQNGVAEKIEALFDRIPRVRPRASTPTLPPAQRTTVSPRALHVRGLTQRFGGFVALDGVDLAVAPGEVVGLLGPNGAGKTTLIDCVSGNNRLSEGTVSFGGQDVTRWAPHRRSRAGLSRSFQSLELFDDLTVRENLLAAADRRDRVAYLTDLVWPGRSPLPGPVVAAVEELRLAPLFEKRAEDLSYGQRRLVAIARAVAGSPSVLLLDEPAAGLDETESEEFGRLIRRLASEWGIGILLIEHDVALVLRTADRVVVLDFGRKIAEGTPEEVREDPAVRKAYLGEEYHAGAS